MAAKTKTIIDGRKAVSRPRELEELATLLRARRYPDLSAKQIELVASHLSYLFPLFRLEAEVGDWLERAAGQTVESIEAYFASAAWRDIFARSQLAGLGATLQLFPVSDESEKPKNIAQEVDPRRNYGIPRICAVFRISAEEESALGFKSLVSERRRSELRRRAEGVPVLGDKPPAAPWLLEGVSKATYYRRRKTIVTDARARLLATITRIEEFGPVPDSYDAVQLALSILPIATVAESLTLPEPPREPYRGTAEARRLAALAARLGLEWRGRSEDPEDWYALPEHGVQVLTAREKADFVAAAGEAVAAEHRLEAIRNAKEKSRSSQKPGQTYPQWLRERQSLLAAERAKREAADAARVRGDCPARVSPYVWDAVPQELRPRVLILTGRMFMQGHEPDIGVALAVVLTRRENATTAAALQLDPTLDSQEVASRTKDYADIHPYEAARKIVKNLQRERADLLERTRLAEQAVAAEVEKRPLLGPTSKYEFIMKEAVQLMVRSNNLRAAHALDQARDESLRWSPRRVN